MKAAAALLSVAALASCYRTRFELAPPQPELVSNVYNEHFHFSVIGILEISRPVDLQAACNGASPTAVEEQISVLGGIVNAVAFALLGILHVHNATLYCPMGQGMPMQPYPSQPSPQGGQPMQPQPYPPQPMPQPQR